MKSTKKKSFLRESICSRQGPKVLVLFFLFRNWVGVQSTYRLVEYKIEKNALRTQKLPCLSWLENPACNFREVSLLVGEQSFFYFNII